jgi:hypothetical protein
MITLYDFGNSVCCQKVRITRGGATWACSACGPMTGRTSGAAGARAREWPSFRRRLYDLMTPAEFKEMQAHGPKIREDVAALLAGLRRDVPPSAQ